MHDVWVCIPTAQKKHVPGVLDQWSAKGYRVALWVDVGPVLPDMPISLLMMGHYPGVWRAWNALAKSVMATGADVCILAGDDMHPDPVKSAQELATEYLAHFPTGLGVMQPCGDPQGDLIDGMPNAGRICGSPWVGRDWVRLAYGGRGPVNPKYTAFYADEELKIVAQQHDALWMRKDVTQYHFHWSWNHLPKQAYHERNQKSWDLDKQLFESSKLTGFAEADFLISNEARPA